MRIPHVASEPAILYFGTPVVLVSTTNEDGTANLAPISSVFWLGWRAMLGIDGTSKNTANLRRTGECVLNLPADDAVGAVNRLARTTGSDPVPEHKVARGYRYEPKKFEAAGLTPVRSETVRPPRVLECPVQLEAVVTAEGSLAGDDDLLRGRLITFSVRIQRVHLDPAILLDGRPNRVDPDKWRPLIMSFQEFYGLRPAKLHHSTLGRIPEHSYLTPDTERARHAPVR